MMSPQFIAMSPQFIAMTPQVSPQFLAMSPLPRGADQGQYAGANTIGKDVPDGGQIGRQVGTNFGVRR